MDLCLLLAGGRLFGQGNRELLVPFPFSLGLCGEECGGACSIRNFDLLDDNKEKLWGEREYPV